MIYRKLLYLFFLLGIYCFLSSFFVSFAQSEDDYDAYYEYDDDRYYSDEDNDEQYEDYELESDIQNYIQSSQEKFQKQTNRRAKRFDWHLYVGGGLGSVINEQGYIDSNAGFDAQTLLSPQRTFSSEFTTNTMFSISSFSIKLDYSYYSYNGINGDNSLFQNLIYHTDDTTTAVDNLPIVAGNYHVVETNIGVNLGRRKKSASYHFIYVGYKLLYNTYQSGFLNILYENTIVNHGFTAGYGMLVDIPLPTSRIFSFLVSFGISFGYLPVTSNRIYISVNQISNPDITTIENNLMQTQNVLVPIANFTTSGKFGFGVNIWGVQILVEYRAEFHVASAAIQEIPNFFLLSQNGIVNNFVFLIGTNIGYYTK